MFNGFFVLVVLRLYSCGNVVSWFVLDIFLGVYIYMCISYIYHSILWDGWPTWYAWIQQCGRRMTVCDENPVAQLVSFRMFHGLAFISLSMLNFGFLWATSMELFRNQAPSSLHVNRFPCASALESFRPRPKEREMAVVANLRRSGIQCHVPRQRIWHCPLSDPKARASLASKPLISYDRFC